MRPLFKIREGTYLMHIERSASVLEIPCTIGKGYDEVMNDDSGDPSSLLPVAL